MARKDKPRTLASHTLAPADDHISLMGRQDHGPSIRTFLRKRTALSVAVGAPDTGTGDGRRHLASRFEPSRRTTASRHASPGSDQHPPTRAPSPAVVSIETFEPSNRPVDNSYCGGRQDVGKETSMMISAI